MKSNDLESWDECYNNHRFTNQQDKLINIKYECLDARDINNVKIVSDPNLEYDDLPFDLSVNGKNQFLHLKNINMMHMIMENIGWTKAKIKGALTESVSLKPDIILSGIEWEEQVKKLKQNVYDKRNANNKASKEQETNQIQYISLNQQLQTLSKLLIGHT